MFVDILILLIGLVLLLYSADVMINSSDSIAKKFQLSPILVGLTIVAFGTSAPELVITLFAAFKEIPATDAIIGNIIGSNIANILLILGTASLFFKIDLSNIGLKDNCFLIILTSYFAAMFYIASSLNFTIIIGLIGGFLMFPAPDFSKSLLVGILLPKELFTPIVSQSLLFLSFVIATFLPLIVFKVKKF